MSNHNLTTDHHEPKPPISDDIFATANNYESSSSVSSVEVTSSAMHDKQQSLVEMANNTFRELCKTLEDEQAKLLELEERRKKLQEEMKQLKNEIEEEKESYKMNIVQSVENNLRALNKTSSDEEPDCIQVVEDFTQEKENNEMPESQHDEDLAVTARNVAAENGKEFLNDQKTIEEQTKHIKSDLQNILTECIKEQCTDKYVADYKTHE